MKRGRHVSVELKRLAMRRVAAGDDVSAVVAEIKVERRRVYEWQEQVRQAGLEALHGTGRQRKNRAMTMSRGSQTIQRRCRLSGVGRADYYHFWQNSAPGQQDTAVRDAIQRVALANGLATATSREKAIVVTHKRVLRGDAGGQPLVPAAHGFCAVRDRCAA